ncbi:MAG TPA: DUF1232 domain-containing protein [Methanofastidiosum sp.]|nr:DUF1232 domain-containing protein [Methanofastidiosum sp.]
MEWYYIALIVILGLFFLIALVVYLLRYRIVNWIMASVLGVYVASPIDLIPDIPIVGWGDDILAIIGIVGFVINGIIMEFKNKKKNRIIDFSDNIYADESGFLRFKSNNQLVPKNIIEKKSKFSFLKKSEDNIIQRRSLCKICGSGVEETELYCKKCGSKLNINGEYEN